MTYIEYNPTVGSSAVANRPQTMGLEGPPQASSMSIEFVYCDPRKGLYPLFDRDRTWRRLENTHENGPESTP